MDPSSQVEQTQQTPQQLVCDFCHVVSSPEFFFCPNCGKELRKKPLSTSVFKQVGLYLFAFFLPPFGLFPGIKYIKQNSQTEKLVGLVMILLTIISTLITVWLTYATIRTAQTLVEKQIQNPLQQQTDTKQIQEILQKQLNTKDFNF